MQCVLRGVGDELQQLRFAVVGILEDFARARGVGADEQEVLHERK